MTMPTQPDTGAGNTDTGSTTADDQQQPDATATDDTDWKAEAEKYKALARKHEDRAKASKKALDEATTDDLAKQLADAQKAQAAAEERAAELAYSSTVTRVAATVGADAEALLDSGAFKRDVAADLLGDEPSDDELKAAIAKVAKEYAKKTRFAAQQGAARSGTDMSGAPVTTTHRAQGLGAAVGAAYRNK